MRPENLENSTKPPRGCFLEVFRYTNQSKNIVLGVLMHCGGQLPPQAKPAKLPDQAWFEAKNEPNLTKFGFESQRNQRFSAIPLLWLLDVFLMIQGSGSSQNIRRPHQDKRPQRSTVKINIIYYLPSNSSLQVLKQAAPRAAREGVAHLGHQKARMRPWVMIPTSI